MTLTMPDQPITRWGRYVQRVLEKHNASTRSQRIRTQVPKATVQDWIKTGAPPRKPNALAFIHGMGEDIEEGLREAGFGEDVPTAHQHLVEGLAALAAEFGTAIPVNWDVEAVKNLTMEDAEIILAEHRESAERMRKKGVI